MVYLHGIKFKKYELDKRGRAIADCNFQVKYNKNSMVGVIWNRKRVVVFPRKIW